MLKSSCALFTSSRATAFNSTWRTNGKTFLNQIKQWTHVIFNLENYGKMKNFLINQWYNILLAHWAKGQDHVIHLHKYPTLKVAVAVWYICTLDGKGRDLVWIETKWSHNLQDLHGSGGKLFIHPIFNPNALIKWNSSYIHMLLTEGSDKLPRNLSHLYD